MPISVTYNGSSYLIPVTGDNSWGATTTAYLTALATGSLTKGGGAFTLASEVNFGSTYGLKLAYLKTESATLAAAGFLRLANNSDSISWRNAANSADLALLVNGSDVLQFNSISLADISSAQTLTNKTMSGSSNTFTNLPATGLTGLVSPANGGTGVANNAASTVTISGAYATTLTVTGATGVTLPTTGTLATLAGVESPTNKTFDHTSTMTGVKIASFTPDGTHTLTAPAVTDTLVGLAAMQTLTNKTLTSPAVTGLTGSLSNPIQSGYEDFTEISTPSDPSSGVLRLYSKSGDNLYMLNSAGGETQISGALTNPMTTLGDTLYENATPAPTRLAGNTTTTKKFLTQTGTGSASAAPAWGTIVGADVPVVVPGTSAGVVSATGLYQPFIYTFGNVTLSNGSLGPTAFPSGTANNTPTGYSKSYGSNTLTVTLPNNGWYRCSVSAYIGAGPVATDAVRLTGTLGGTATLYNVTSNAASPNNAQQLSFNTYDNNADPQTISESFYVNATAGQTVTLTMTASLPVGTITSGSIVNSLTFTAAAI